MHAMMTLYKISQKLCEAAIGGHKQDPATKSCSENDTTLFTSMKPYNHDCGPDDQRYFCQDVDGIEGNAKSALGLY